MKEIKELLEPIEVCPNPDDYEDTLDDVLNDIYGEIEICGYTYNSAYALKELDPIAYRQELLNYVDDIEPQYECPICGEVHDNYDDAYYCCQTDEDEDEDED